MGQVLKISDALYEELAAIARERGLQSIEELLQQMLETWRSEDKDLEYRQRIVEEIKLLREHLTSRYGPMPDSIELIRADRI